MASGERFGSLLGIVLRREWIFPISSDEIQARRASEWIHTHGTDRCRMRREIPTQQGADPLAGASS